jgi:MSHA pilin protein MshD
VVIAIVILVVTGGLGKLFRQSVDPWQQVRATEIGQSLMNEILSRRFDENSQASNQSLRCSEDGAGDCATLGTCPSDGSSPETTEEPQRKNFDDVDDYHCLELDGEELSDFDENLYKGFNAKVFVSYEVPKEIKLITIEVQTPQQEILEFSAQKGNW